LVAEYRGNKSLQIDQRLRAEPDCFVEQRDIEIGNADMACETLALRFCERADRRATAVQRERAPMLGPGYGTTDSCTAANEVHGLQ
jgi:hypothetical protein